MHGCDASGTHDVVTHATELRVLARCLAREDAADLLQDTWVAALGARTRPRRVGAWLRQVMRNEHRAGIRSSRRRRDREEHTPHDTHVSAMDDDLVHTELVLAMLSAVEALAEPYRGVVQARFLAGRTPTEIALDSGSPPATVRWQLHEGLRRIRERLDERYGDRRHWHGGALAIGAWPIDTATNTTMITRLAAMKWFAGLAIVGGSATIVAAQWPSEAAADSPSTTRATNDDAVLSTRSAAAPAQNVPTSPAIRAVQADVADDAPAPTEPAGPGCAGCEHGDGEPHRMMMKDNADLASALAACEHLVPNDAGEGRFEIEVTVRGQADALGNAIEGVSVTRGRKLPCVDADAALEDADEDDFVRFDAVAQCMQRSLATTFVEPVADGAMHTMVEVLRDDTRTPDTSPLPSASSAIDGVDPREAIDHFDLAPRGKPDAPVSIVECGGYDCSYCNRARPTMDELSDRYGDAIALHYLQMPLDMQPGGNLTARAAVAAGLQGKFWEMHDALFDDAKLRSEAGIIARAVELGMDGERFARDLAAESTAQAVADQRGVCMAAGAEGTPAFFINGDLVTGAQDISAFTTVIDDELAAQRAK